MQVDAIAHQTQFPGIMQALPTMSWTHTFHTMTSFNFTVP